MKHLLLTYGHGTALAFIVAMLFMSCKKETLNANKDQVLGYDYYPLVQGKYIIYNVEEITIDKPIARFDTVRYQLKELLVDTLPDTSDMVRFKLDRYTRATSSGEWNIHDVWCIWRNNKYLIKVEENIPFIKQSYPLKGNLTWNGNSFNTLDSATYSLVAFDREDTISNTKYLKVATVEHNNFESLFEKHLDQEKYVRGIGLVYYRSINIESQASKGIVIDVSIPIMQRITRGTIVTWALDSHNFTTP